MDLAEDSHKDGEAGEDRGGEDRVTADADIKCAWQNLLMFILI